MRHCVQQRRSKFLALPRGLNLGREVLRARPFQSNGDQVGDSLEDCIRHLSSLQCKSRNRLCTQAHRRNYAIVLGVGEGRALQRGIVKLIFEAIEI